MIFNLLNEYNVVPLKDCCETIFSGITPKSGGAAYTESEEGILFVKSGSLSNDGSLTIDATSKIKTEIHNGLMKSSKLKRNDVLIAIVGATIGKVALFDLECEANINQAIAAVRLKTNTILPEFLIAYLISPFGQAYLEYLKRPVARANINLQEIGEIGIPLLSIEKQKRFISLYSLAKEQKNIKLQRANKLLAGVSNIVLERLGLSFDLLKTNMTYAVLYSSVENRLDADYYSPKFVDFRRQIENSKHKVVTIDEISKHIITGFAAGKQDQAEDLPEEQRVPQLRPFSITSEGELSFETKKYVPVSSLKASDYCQKNEVIFNNTNSPELVGKTTVFDSDVLCAASNHMTRIMVKDGVNPYYISAFFNVLLSIGYWKLLCTNFNNQAGVNIETLKNARIPLPPKELQDEIAMEIMQRRGKVNALRKEADFDWKKAKKKFEEELLEG